MDPEAIENTVSVDTTTTTTTPHDGTTDELVSSLETGVDKAYTTIQGTTLNGLNKIQGMVAEKLPELQKQWNDVNVNVNELTKNLNLDSIKDKVKLDNLKLDNLKLDNLKLDDYVKKEDLDNLKQTSTEFISKAGENTNKALDNLDSELEKIENMTISYAQQLGGTLGSFIKSQMEPEATAAGTSSWNWSGWGKQLSGFISGDSPETVLSQEKKTELLFTLPKGISPGTRAESQVHELQSDASVYTGAFQSGEFKDYAVSDEQKAEAKDLLAKESLHLVAVYKKVVSEEEDGLTDDDFWKVYFGKRAQIIGDEQQRRELLEKSKVDENEDEFDWDE